MPLPTNVGTGTVIGKFIDTNGTAMDGTVTFTPSAAKLLDATASPAPVTILPKAVTVTLSAGAFSATLVATNDADLNPTGWTYTATFSLTGATVEPFSFALPQGTTVDLTLVSPVAESGGTTITRGASAYEVAVSNGFSGNEAAWLASLVGPSGGGGEGGGVPSGGTTGQVLAKTSGTNYAVGWTTVSGAGPATVADLPAGSTLTVAKSGGTWPARPTSRADIVVHWKGADPSPAIVSSGTGGMRDGIDVRLVTP